MSGGSYLNSSVSLISKACVRYEGTLYSIDPQEATITLSKVRSFGTEDRKLEGFIAPSDTVFDFIIFNANDIKELIVDEPLNDPAIVTAQMPTSTTKNANTGFNENQSSQQNGVSEQAGLKNINRQSNLASASSAGQNDCFKSRGSTPSSSQARSPTSELSSNKQKTDLHKTGMNRNQNQNNRNNMNNMNNNRKAWDNRGSNFYNNQRFDNRNNNRNLNYNNNMNRRPGNYQNNNYSNYNQRNQGFRRNDDRVSNMPNKNGYRNNNNNNINNRGVRKFNPQNKKVDPTLKTEFDFERANQVFQQMVEKLDDLNLSLNGEKGEKSDAEDKEETKNEIEKVDKADEESNFYDKTKSFFDNISCEAAERSKGTKNRLNWKQERKLNAETFGFKITYRRNDYNGGYRSRPAYNNNNNNNRNVSNRRYNNNNNNGNRNTTRMNSS